MDHMKFETPDLTAQNIEKIAALFPGCVTEGPDGKGGLKKAINFELLRQMLSDDVLEGDEAYEFTWVGKKASIVEANKPIRKTLRPCPEESKNWDTTENLYIEGDNLEVLKLLQEAYLGKVKMIYIDPPYNTGHDFIYNDRFEMDKQEYDQQIGLFDEDGNKQFAENSESNPRFHSDWCSMMYPRLMLARNMLADDGVIFISIDDNEQENLKKLCDEVFGSSNFIGQFVWQRRTSPDMRKLVSTAHDYIVAYSKNITNLAVTINKVSLTAKDKDNYKNPDNDPRGPWTSSDFTAQGYRPNQMYEIVTPGGAKYTPPEGKCWKTIESEFIKQCEEGRIWFGKDGMGIPRRKTYLCEREGKNVWTWWPNSDVGHSQEATQEVIELFDGHNYFNYPKPTRLLRKIIQIGSHQDSLIVDFFSGAATTAHAVMQLNAEDGGHRKFIMVQLPEPCDEKSEAYKAGYKNICEIGKERIRRAGEELRDNLFNNAALTLGTAMFLPKEENEILDESDGLIDKASGFDNGFRVLKLDDTNMEDVYYSAQEYDQGMLQKMESNIKPDRTDLDLLFGCLLEWGLPLSMPYRSEQVEGCTVHTYNDGDLIACFDENIPENVIREIAKRKPLRAVFRDSGFATSPEKINVGEIFKLLAPDTRVKVI